MKNILLTLALSLVGTCSLLHAQQDKQIDRYDQIWLGYLTQTQLSPHWGIWFDTHWRSQSQWHHGLLFGMGRVGVTYIASPSVKITAGYAFLNFFPDEVHPGVSQPEHRPWQQLQIINNRNKLRWLHQFRLEQRFRQRIEDGVLLPGEFSYTNRIRYNAIASYPISQNGKWTLAASHEILLNFGKSVAYNPFDQDRLFLGAGYKITPNTNLQFGYMYIFQQTSKGYLYKQSNIARVFLFHNLDFSRP